MLSFFLLGFHYFLYSMLLIFFFLMIRRPPRSTRTDTLFPYTTLFRSLADHGHLITLVAGRADVVERPCQLGIATDQVARLDQQSGQGVVDAATLAGRLGDRHVDQPVLCVVHVDGALRHPVGDAGRSEERRVGKECVSTGKSRW